MIKVKNSQLTFEASQELKGKLHDLIFKLTDYSDGMTPIVLEHLKKIFDSYLVKQAFVVYNPVAGQYFKRPHTATPDHTKASIFMRRSDASYFINRLNVFNKDWTIMEVGVYNFNATDFHD